VLKFAPSVSPETLRMVYFAYVHSILSYGIILGGNQPYSEKIFKIQNRVIRIITNSRTRDSCRELFKKLEILPLYSPYILYLSIFVIKNKHYNLPHNIKDSANETTVWNALKRVLLINSFYNSEEYFNYQR
jgi:hypothetical protein